MLPSDFMHLLCSGHGPWLLSQYMDKDSDCSLTTKIYLIEQTLRAIRLPHTFNRKIYDFKNNSKWKCSQKKIFFFYLSIPTLINIQTPEYFILLCGYVCAIRLLYEPIIDIKDIDIAENLLNSYHDLLDENFGSYAYDLTVHLLKHLAEQVRKHGPLHCHSQFFFEGCIHNILLMIAGSRGYLGQIITKLNESRDLERSLKEFSFASEKLRELTRQSTPNDSERLIVSQLRELSHFETQKIEIYLRNLYFNYNLSTSSYI